MHRLILILSVVFVLVGTIFGIFLTVSGQGNDGAGDPLILREEMQGGNIRQITAPNQNVPLAEDSPDISFIDSPTPFCYQPDPAQNDCYINWYYLSVNSAPASYMITMTVNLDNRNVAHIQGFFQNSMYVPHTMNERGFRVECGALGSGGKPNLGKGYNFMIQARDSNGLGSTNSGKVFCPAHIP